MAFLLPQKTAYLVAIFTYILMDFLKILLPIYNKSVKAHSLAELQTLEIFSASIGIAYNEKEVDYSVFPTSSF